MYMLVHNTMNVILLLVRERARPSIKHRAWTCLTIIFFSLPLLPNSYQIVLLSFFSLSPSLSLSLSLYCSKQGIFRAAKLIAHHGVSLRYDVRLRYVTDAKEASPRSAAYHYGAHIHGCQTICQRVNVHERW